MEESISEDMVKVLRKLETLLINKQFTTRGLENTGGRLSSFEIEEALRDYGGEITAAPDSFLKRLTVIRLQREPPAWHIDFDLWIDNRRSDLTLSVELISQINGDFDLEILNIHVL